MTRSLQLLTLICICGVLFYYALVDRDLWSSHEGRAAQNAQSMLSDNAWGMPKLFDGRPDLQKPPLYYWLVALFGTLFGGRVDAWSVRLPAAIAATGTVFWIYALGCLRNQRNAGFLAALALATMVHFTWLGRTGRIDTVLCFAISLALGGFYLAHTSDLPFRKTGWLALGYCSVAAAVMLKGPIGIVLPFAVVAVFLFMERTIPSPIRLKKWVGLIHRTGLWWGIPLVLGLTLPWFLWANRATNGEYFNVFFWQHNIQRGFGGSETLASYPWWYYAPRLCVDLFPWSILLPFCVWIFLKRRWWSEEPLAQFGILWATVIVALLSLATFKRADYLLPAYPGFAIFLGVVYHRWVQQRDGHRRWAFAPAFIIVLSVFGWVVFVKGIMPRNEPHRERTSFAKVIRHYHPLPAPVIFFRVEDHALAFHVGRPVDTILEWENINVWAGRTGTFYIVMHPDAAAAWPEHLSSGCLEEVARNSDRPGSHEEPLVLLRTCSHPAPVGNQSEKNERILPTHPATASASR